MIKSMIKLIRSFSQKTQDDYMSSFAAQAAFFIFVSAFPFIMFLFTLMNYLPFTENELLDVVSRFMPNQVGAIISSVVVEIYSKSSGAVLSVTIITAVWSASLGILAIYRGLNSIYGIRETRNYFVIRFRSMLYTILFAVILLLILALYVFGNQIILFITSFFPMLITTRPAILVISFRTLIGSIVLFIIFLCVYKFIPNRKTKLHKEIPGALISSVGWLGFSYLYSFYIDNLSNMSATYGSLTAIVLCMIWLYSCMSILFFGAEINSVFSKWIDAKGKQKLSDVLEPAPSAAVQTPHTRKKPENDPGNIIEE